MDLLTKAEYLAIARSLDFPAGAFIDGAFRSAASGKTFASINPATGEELVQVAACGPGDVDLAVARARDAFEDGRWSRLHPADRKDVLIRMIVRRDMKDDLLTRIAANVRESVVGDPLDPESRVGALVGKAHFREICGDFGKAETVLFGGEGDITTPFGGWKQSGFGGRDNGLAAHDQYTRIKTVWLDLADDEDEVVG